MASSFLLHMTATLCARTPGCVMLHRSTGLVMSLIMAAAACGGDSPGAPSKKADFATTRMGVVECLPPPEALPPCILGRPLLDRALGDTVILGPSIAVGVWWTPNTEREYVYLVYFTFQDSSSSWNRRTDAHPDSSIIYWGGGDIPAASWKIGVIATEVLDNSGRVGEVTWDSLMFVTATP